MHEENKQPAPLPTSAPERGNDTYSYRGWLVSDRLYKRALVVYGHYLVGALMIAIPIIIVLLISGIGLGAFLSAKSAHDRPSVPEMKIDIVRVCDDSLAYTSFPDGSSTERYLLECKEGKHPEVIERFKENLDLPSDSVL